MLVKSVSKARLDVCNDGPTLAICLHCPDTVRPPVQTLLVRRWSTAFLGGSLRAMPRFRSAVDMAAWRCGRGGYLLALLMHGVVVVRLRPASTPAALLL